ncbi:DUF4097 family beta strand repeat protein [Nonomuraea sp. NN258]|uniref:DUF4097 family beta strand repeat-containing protein n=1 Tax=Nonomuraea antri TaxID=2730852 RepID=UPI0015690885|nr:DUF4097 family beta strand repeat-containing protein [Nonomuraea antri]NRQ34252.1 DUF4097 family beta strand repeat protein [Nonomuraea antri]
MKKTLIAGGFLASAALLTGCGISAIGGPTNHDNVSYAVKEKVATLRVETGAGDVEITETGTTEIKVTENLYWNDDKPEAEHRVEGDTLVVSYKCPSSWGNCGVNYVIEVPKGLRVKLDSGSGDLTLRSLSGDLEVNVGSGEIDGNGLAGKKFLAESGSGNLELKYASAPESVEVETGSGDITLRVPNEGYNVRTDLGSGDTKVDVKNDPGAPRAMTLRSGSGDVSVLAG